MINAENFVKNLEKNGVSFFVGVPDSFLNSFCNYLKYNYSNKDNVIAANEGNAIAIAAGYSFGKNCIPLVYMQNSGIGNALNPLVSLVDKNVYSVPMVLLIGWRGGPNSLDREQHKTQGEITTSLLDIMKIPYRVLENDDLSAEKDIFWATSTAKKINGAVALIAPKGVFTGEKAPIKDNSFPLSREQAMEIVLNTVPKDTYFSATTGRAARELYALREKRGEPHNHDYLNVGSMGHASSVAFGMALSSHQSRVICFDGDAAAIMHMGCMAIHGQINLANFLHIVLNNGMHESVGGQLSAGRSADLTKVAKACGYATVDFSVNDKASLEKAVKELLSVEKAGFIDVQIHGGLRPDLPPLIINHNEVINELRANIRKED